MKPGQFITRIILLLLIGLAVSCDERNISIEADQNVVFEVNYSNSAWFKQFKGFLIDRNGSVKTYDNPVSWNPVKENQEVTAGQMQENLLHTSESPFKVPVQQMEQYITKAGHVLSNYSKPARIGADHGIIRYYAYLYDEKNRLIRRFYLHKRAIPKFTIRMKTLLKSLNGLPAFIWMYIRKKDCLNL